MTTKKFKIGQTYSTRSICNHECIFSFKVIKRTAKSVWIEEQDMGLVRGETGRKKITVWKDAESFKPFGSYSMAPIVTAY